MAWANSPQIVSLLADVCIFITAGMNLAFGLGWNYYVVTNHFRFCWFIAVMIGALIAAPLTQYLKKRFYVMIASVLVTVGGIIFTSAPLNGDAAVAARYINGIAIGFVTVAFIVHSSEIATSSNRAACLSLEQLGVALGIFVQVMYTSEWPQKSHFSPNRVHGIICLSLGVIAFALSFLIIESPVFHVRRSNDAEALDCLTRLQRPTVLTEEKKLLLEEHKNYVLANEYLGGCDSLVHGSSALLKMLLYRSLLAFSYSLPLNDALLTATLIGAFNFWPTMVSAATRVTGALIAWVLLDRSGRKALGLASVLAMAGLGTAITITFAYINNWTNRGQMKTACLLLIFFQLFAGSFAPTTTAYLGEAFPLLWKPYKIALCVIVENMVHLIVICTFIYGLHSLYVFNTFTYVLLYVCFVLYLLVLPETRNTSLQEAQERFRRPLYLRCS